MIAFSKIIHKKLKRLQSFSNVFFFYLFCYILRTALPPFLIFMARILNSIYCVSEQKVNFHHYLFFFLRIFKVNGKFRQQ